MFPGHRCRLARSPAGEGAKLVEQIEAAKAVFGQTNRGRHVRRAGLHAQQS